MKIILVITILLYLPLEMHSQNLIWREMNEYDVGIIHTIIKNDKEYIMPEHQEEEYSEQQIMVYPGKFLIMVCPIYQ